MDLSTTEPTTLRAGDSIAWSRALPEYSAADGWSLKYRLLWPSGPSVDIVSTAAGAIHTVNLTPAETAVYAPGPATMVAYVERTAPAAERITLQTQAVSILPDLTTGGPYDGRSQNQIALADARAALASYMKKGQMHVAEYDIAGRTMKFRDVDQITNLIQHYEREVFKENAARATLNGVSPGRVQVRF